VIKRQRGTIDKLKIDNTMLKREISAYGKDAAIFTELTKAHMNHAQVGTEGRGCMSYHRGLLCCIEG
jgi:hypothetical protein